MSPSVTPGSPKEVAIRLFKGSPQRSSSALVQLYHIPTIHVSDTNPNESSNHSLPFVGNPPVSIPPPAVLQQSRFYAFWTTSIAQSTVYQFVWLYRGGELDTSLAFLDIPMGFKRWFQWGDYVDTSAQGGQPLDVFILDNRTT